MFVEDNILTLQTACMFIRKQADKLAEHLAELGKTEDIEPLHQTRVACRRLREAVVFFADCFEPAYVEGWKKATKKLLGQLGEPRDLDVQIVFLEQFIAGLDPTYRTVRPGLERLLLRQKQRRQKLQHRAKAAVKQFQKKHILPNLRLQMDKVLYLAETCPLPERQDGLLSRLIQQLSPRLKEAQKRQSCLDDPLDTEGHHKLRIAIKKLRYTIEIIDVILSGKLAEYLESFKEAQTVLGELHDCDVWLEIIEQFEEKEKQRMRDYIGHTRGLGRLRPGLKHLQQNRTELRQLRYQEAVSLMGRWNDHRLLERLRETIEQASQ